MELDVNDIRRLMIQASQLRRVDDKFTFYYDETNNIGKFYLTDHGTNVVEHKNFILGGIVLEGDQTLPDIAPLRTKLRMQSNATEIKFAHVAKGGFEQVLSSQKLEVVLSWIVEHDIMIHYSSVNIIYWSIVDIVDSILAEEKFASYQPYHQAMKNELYRLVCLDKPAFLALMKHHHYPDIRRDKTADFVADVDSFLSIHSPDDDNCPAFMLKALIEKSASLPELAALVENEDGITAACTQAVHAAARDLGMNLRCIDDHRTGLSLDETCNESDVVNIWTAFAVSGQSLPDFTKLFATAVSAIPPELQCTSAYLTHPVFHRHRSETQMLRYLRSLADKDLALDRTMIPLGSCTMKLNATAEMIPITWPEFADIHPFAPPDQTRGYARLIAELEQMLAACTGYDAVSLQPNAGSQGEYAGLLAIRAYHHSRGDTQRTICLIPGSAHGTNPASAHMAGMQVVVVRCDDAGNVDVANLKAKAEQHAAQLAALMITYPSTHGIFETAIREICAIVHDNGGQVYIDGANMNAMVGLCQPGRFGGDVSHLNLHKTFCIPHGGGGPGVGPIGVKSHLIPFLPGHHVLEQDLHKKNTAVCAAPWGSAGILPISWTYIRLMGQEGLKHASQVAILNANYIAKRLSAHFPILYAGADGIVAHECIVDLRTLKEATGITVDDVAKRLMDFGFHAPTMSFPVPGTLMIEPTHHAAWGLFFKPR